VCQELCGPVTGAVLCDLCQGYKPCMAQAWLSRQGTGAFDTRLLYDSRSVEPLKTATALGGTEVVVPLSRFDDEMWTAM